MRRYDDTVEVRERCTETPGEQEPEAFLWRDRVYVVREVLGHWRERRSWWSDDAAARLLGLAADDLAGAGAGAVTGDVTGDVTREVAGDRTDDPIGAERRVWRVEAGAGRSAPTGVFDLSCSGDGRAWHLLRVAD